MVFMGVGVQKENTESMGKIVSLKSAPMVLIIRYLRVGFEFIEMIEKY